MTHGIRLNVDLDSDYRILTSTLGVSVHMGLMYTWG